MSAPESCRLALLASGIVGCALGDESSKAFGVIRVVAQRLLQARLFSECHSKPRFIAEHPLNGGLRCRWAVGQPLRQGERMGSEFTRRDGRVNQSPLCGRSGVESVAEQSQRFGTGLPDQSR